MGRARRVALSLVVAALAAPLLGAGKPRPGLDRVNAAGKLVVAMDVTYPPMESEGPDGKPVGYDVELARELGARLKLKVDFVVMNWDGILAGLVSKRYDVIISAMNVTDERRKQVDFVEYARISQLFVAKKGTIVGNEKDLAGKVVAVQADTTSSAYLEARRKAGIAIKDVKAFKLATDAFAAIKAGQAEVVVVDEPVGRYYAKQDPATFQVTGRALAPEPIGIAVRKDEKPLAEAIGTAVEAMRKDGTLKKLAEKWFGGELGI
jgi:polar amino acid transport system substrate-binding protein